MGRRRVRRGFGFYLLFSIFLHLCLLFFIPFFYSPEVKVEHQKKVYPVRLVERAPLRPPGTAVEESEIIPPRREFLTDGSLAGLRNRQALHSNQLPDAPVASGQRFALQEQLRRFVVDPARAGPLRRDRFVPESPSVSTPADYVQPRPVQLSFDEELLVDFPKDQTFREQPEVSFRPAFPYARVSGLFPEQPRELVYRLQLNSRGYVLDVQLLYPEQPSELTSNISEWLKSWRYDAPGKPVGLNVTVAVPGS